MLARTNDFDYMESYCIDSSGIMQTNDSLEEQKCYNALWGAVVLQALVDATSNYKRTEYRIEKQKAKSWLLDMNQDFTTVCQLSRYEPQYVQRQAKEIIAEGRQCKTCASARGK